MAKGDRWTLAFYDHQGEDASPGWTTDWLTDAVRRVMLRFEHNDRVRYASIAHNDRPFVLVSAAPESYTATVTAIATDERVLTDKELRALTHVENMLRSGVRVHRGGTKPPWRLPRIRHCP